MLYVCVQMTHANIIIAVNAIANEPTIRMSAKIGKTKVPTVLISICNSFAKFIACVRATKNTAENDKTMFAFESITLVLFRSLSYSLLHNSQNALPDL